VKYPNLRVMIYVTAAFYIFLIKRKFPYFVVINVIPTINKRSIS